MLNRRTRFLLGLDATIGLRFCKWMGHARWGGVLEDERSASKVPNWPNKKNNGSGGDDAKAVMPLPTRIDEGARTSPVRINFSQSEVDGADASKVGVRSPKCGRQAMSKSCRRLHFPTLGTSTSITTFNYNIKVGRMIVRSAFRCLTCNQSHTVRIGMGQENRQQHRFPCRHCGEDIVIALCIDYEQITHWVEPVENAECIEEVAGAAIVNVDANFIVPVEQRHKDYEFPRLKQAREIFKVAEENGSIVTTNLEKIQSPKWQERPFRRPDYQEEWKSLKISWSLHRRGREHLINDRLTSASNTYYASEPLNSVQDWLWRFLLFYSQPAFEIPFRKAFARIQPLFERDEFKRFREHYNHNSSLRAERYFELIKSYFENYDQFSQVHFYVVRGIEIPDANVISSPNFSSVKMFYGNAFESLSSSVDILAYLGNMIAGRHFDQFQKLTLKEYLKLDKPGRFGAFAGITEFDALCVERDNQLRNASHHGGTRLDTETQMIALQAGKGGQGQSRQISLARYLERCDQIFMQINTLFRVEIMMCQVARGFKMPI